MRTRTSGLLATLLAFAAVCWVAPARAQEAPPATSEEDLRRAVMLYEESERLYNSGDFAEAAALLRRAYELHPDATLLFNLARALEGIGDLDGAIDGYERYLAGAEAIEDRGAIERRLATLRAQRERLARGGAAEDAQADGSADGAGAVDAPAPTPAAPGRAVDPAPWIVMAAGLAVVAVGAGLGGASLAAGEAAAAEPVQATAVERHELAWTYAITADVLFAAGGVLAGIGLVWGIVSLTSGDASVEAAIGPGGATLRGRF